MSVYPLSDASYSHIRSKSSGNIQSITVEQSESDSLSNDPKQEFASSFLHVEIRPSLLSSEAPVQNYRGLYNLAGIALVRQFKNLVIKCFLLFSLF
jgi:hypothetical protein